MIKCIIDRAETLICLDDKKVTENYLDLVKYANQLPSFIDSIEEMIKQCFINDTPTEE